MIILEDYRKTETLLRKLGGLSKGFGFTINVCDQLLEAPSEEEALKLEVLELASKNEVLEGENATLTENNTQLMSELEASKSETEEPRKKMNAEKEPRKRRTKAEMEADKNK